MRGAKSFTETLNGDGEVLKDHGEAMGRFLPIAL